MPLVGGVARIYRGSPAVDRGELMQEGVVGLLRALSRYDLEQGTPFWAYASWWVRQAMQQLVVRADPAGRPLRPGGAPARAGQGRSPRAPAGPRQGAVAAGAGRRDAPPAPAGREPRRRGAQPARARGARHRETRASSARSATCSPTRRPRPRSSACRTGSRSSACSACSKGLSERERTILHGRFGLDCAELTLRELAERLGVSAERVRQIEERALSRLRDAVDSEPERPRYAHRMIMATPRRSSRARTAARRTASRSSHAACRAAPSVTSRSRGSSTPDAQRLRRRDRRRRAGARRLLGRVVRRRAA